MGQRACLFVLCAFFTFYAPSPRAMRLHLVLCVFISFYAPLPRSMRLHLFYAPSSHSKTLHFVL